MALDSWNNIDKFTQECEEYYCAFLDILGYKNKSDEFFNESFNLYGRFERALSVSIDMWETVGQTGLANTSELGVKFFSDSIVVTHPKKRNEVDALYNVLMFCRVLATHLSFEGLFVRGGISVGDHVEKNNTKFSFLSSKALEKAYKLESEKAVTPRILIDENVVKDAKGHTLSLIIKDRNEYMLHFAPQLINDQGDNQSVVKKEMKDIYRIYKYESNQKVKEKYQWLLSYYYWTLTTTPNIIIRDFEKFKVGDVDSFEKVEKF
ncbi:hypothetical protein BCT11_04535 [Vibrio sp. 10N.222.52.B12]|uniref:hypothetical protein n=1 Tax=Vibrio sp. 10N.222.52.B12 TaxID=1880840 RepID=UPI000C849933|nr:hypothetical protein [Vibrio sp. 10N.222.52.B12]PMO47802.1 hypothetical protein BCT11_04535 [Vibrio sp. 10N.222.52.B12]